MRIAWLVWEYGETTPKFMLVQPDRWMYERVQQIVYAEVIE